MIERSRVEKFVTEDGYVLYPVEKNEWADSVRPDDRDQTFATNAYTGTPQNDVTGEPLYGTVCYRDGTSEEIKPPEPLYDVNAAILDSTGGGDGAYDLIGRGLTVDEFLARLREALTLGDGLGTETGYGLTNAVGHVHLSIKIARAGKGDDTPMG